MKNLYITFLLSLASPAVAEASRLRGSPESMENQHTIAVKSDLAFTRSDSEVRALVNSRELTEIVSTDDYKLSDVSFPYARPEVRLFIERLGAQYRAANGTPLIVTSLTRPAETQPRNSHRLSVHPAGMAVDLRIPADASARRWLESALLSLESKAVIDATREHFPPHYHIAVFPTAYATYVNRLEAVAPEKAPTAQLLQVTQSRDGNVQPSAVLATSTSNASGALVNHAAEHGTGWMAVLIIVATALLPVPAMVLDRKKRRR